METIFVKDSSPRTLTQGRYMCIAPADLEPGQFRINENIIAIGGGRNLLELEKAARLLGLCKKKYCIHHINPTGNFKYNL